MPDISPAGREVLIQDMNRETFSLLVERRFRDVTGSFFTASTSFLDHPIKLEAAEVEAAQRRGRLILEFMDECLAIARECVIEDGDPVLRQLLFSDVLPHTSIEWHRQLPDSAWTRPIWFRTDESPEGVIYEVQCPGSGWGDLLLLKDCLLQHGTGTLSSDDIRAKFVSDVKDVTGQAVPSILHLLDNASAPWGMRYFIEATRGDVRYFGYDSGVVASEIDLVRSHSFYGLVAENRFRQRLGWSNEQRTAFDCPPHVIFDQKATQLLPFLPATRSRFSDHVRALFPYTTVATVTGFVDRDGAFLEWADVIGAKKLGRSYWLKYGGSDTCLNWGSMAVWRLGKNNQQRQLDIAVAGISRGELWLVQEGASSHAPDQPYEKRSFFYGPSGMYGSKHMHSTHFKTHGQPGTIVSIGEWAYEH